MGNDTVPQKKAGQDWKPKVDLESSDAPFSFGGDSGSKPSTQMSKDESDGGNAPPSKTK